MNWKKFKTEVGAAVNSMLGTDLIEETDSAETVLSKIENYSEDNSDEDVDGNAEDENEDLDTEDENSEEGSTEESESEENEDEDQHDETEVSLSALFAVMKKVNTRMDGISAKMEKFVSGADLSAFKKEMNKSITDAKLGRVGKRSNANDVDTIDNQRKKKGDDKKETTLNVNEIVGATSGSYE